MSKQNGKLLRFGALVRVSTEKQERHGESLRTQRSDITDDAARLHGKVVEWYGGQEHAMPGHETKELDRLLADAAKKKFDAVIVSHADRWSRDNAKSKAGLKTLREAGVRFYVRTQEHDLFNPTQTFFLGMSAEIGEFNAGTQSLKSLLNKIARAKRGIPTSGRKPIGRLYDKANHKWSIDKKVQAIYQDIAERYVADESLSVLCQEYGLNHSNVCRNLRDNCGDTHVIEFKVSRFNVDEVVTIKVPPLLPAKLIKAVQQRQTAKRTYLHGKPKNSYLLGGHVFCAECGYTMVGQTNHGGRRYYRHAHSHRARECSLTDPRPWVRADGPHGLESKVASALFNMFGSPAHMERAIKAAVPNYKKVVEQRERIVADLAKVSRVRDRILLHIANEAISDKQAGQQLQALKDRESALQEKLSHLEGLHVPDAKEIRQAVVRFQREGADIMAYFDDGGPCDKPWSVQPAGGNDVGTWLLMNDADKKKLVDAAFTLPQVDGKPAGVYITSVDPGGRQPFSYKLRGQLLSSRSPCALY